MWARSRKRSNASERFDHIAAKRAPSRTGWKRNETGMAKGVFALRAGRGPLDSDSILNSIVSTVWLSMRAVASSSSTVRANSFWRQRETYPWSAIRIS